MNKLLPILFLFFSGFLCAQEKISDFTFKGVINSTNLNGKIGFAQIGDKHYMLEEGDSLKIYLFNSDRFELMHTLVVDNTTSVNEDLDLPNRSHFVIRKNKYYRLLRDKLQIINVEDGVLEQNIAFWNENVKNYHKFELTDNALYVTFLDSDNDYQLYSYDLVTGAVTDISYENNTIVNDDFRLSFVDSNMVKLTNILTNKDSIFTLPLSFKSVFYSEVDSIFYIIDKEHVHKISLNFTHESTLCQNSFSSQGLEDNFIFNDKLILYYSHPKDDFNANQDSIVILDYNTCTTMAFVTEPIPDYAENRQYINNEFSNRRFSMLGYYGHHPADGLDVGLFYLIDHEKKTATAIKNVTTFDHNTLFQQDSFVYCIGKLGNYFGYMPFLFKYNIENQSYKIIFLENQENIRYSSIVLGYQEDKGLILSANNDSEKPEIFYLDKNDSLVSVQKLDFAENLGINYVFGKFNLHDQQYFINYNGLFSLDDTCHHLINFYPRELVHFDESPNISMNIYTTTHFYTSTNYGDFIATVNYAGNYKYLIKRYNTLTGSIDSLVVSAYNPSFKSVGPYIFLSRLDVNSFQIYDIKSHKRKIIPNFNLAFDVLGGESFLVIKDIQSKITTIDYDSNQLTEYVDSNLGELELIPGHKNAFYIQSNISNKTQFYILNKSTGLKLLPFEINNYTKISTKLRLPDERTSLVLIWNKDRHQILEIENEEIKTIDVHSPGFSLYNRFSIIGSDKVIFDFEGFSYLYRKGQDVIKISEIKNLMFLYVKDSTLLFSYMTAAGDLNLFEYNFINGDNISTDITNEECVTRYNPYGIPISDSKFLCSSQCNSGSELYVLNVEDKTLKLLSDINGGPSSSFPRNFTRYKDWVYFTAIHEGQNNQWYRYPTSFMSNVDELPPLGEVKLKINPSPASSNISLEVDANQISIFNADGQHIRTLNDYTAGQSIDVQVLPSGIYFIYAIDKFKKVKTGKFVKIK